MSDNGNRKISGAFYRHVNAPLENFDPNDGETSFKLFFACDLYRDEFASGLRELLQSGRPLLYAYHNTERAPLFYSYDKTGLERARLEWREHDIGRLRVVLVDDMKVSMFDKVDPKVFKDADDRLEAFNILSYDQRASKHCVSVVSVREMQGFPLDLKDVLRSRMH